MAVAEGLAEAGNRGMPPAITEAVAEREGLSYSELRATPWPVPVSDIPLPLPLPQRSSHLPTPSSHRLAPTPWELRVKYGIDRVAALVAILLTLPILLVAALGTLLTLGGPVLFRQRRTSLHGREFSMLKFRTMKDHAAPTASPREPAAIDTTVGPGGVENGLRPTRFGSFLRSTSIDELPQLINVLRGDMSLIGPRPERPEFADRFSDGVPDYRYRTRVKAGITGWAQVQGLRGRTSLIERVAADNYYIENWSIWLDLKIVPLTLLAMVARRGS